MRVQISEHAESDLVDIAVYIALDNPELAYRYVDELEAACTALAEQPERFALLPGFEARGYRRRPHGRHAIIYVVADKTVRILRILSSAMDLDRALD